MKTPVYFDNAATTPIRNEVIEIITSVMKIIMEMPHLHIVLVDHLDL